MTPIEFTKLLTDKNYRSEVEGDKITVTHQGNVYLGSLTNIPEGVTFRNGGWVYLPGLTTLSEDVTFENKGDVDLHRLTKLPEGVTFENGGYVNLSSLTTLPEGVTFENGCAVYLRSLTTLPEGVTFENGGNVHLLSLTTLPDSVRFENEGSVHLARLTTLPEGVTFHNDGHVRLPSLKTLPEGVRFENLDYVDLPSLNGHHVYRGAMRQFRNVDGYTMLITSTKQRGEYRFHRAKYFGGGDIESLSSCYVAESKGLYAHGKTAKQAIEDLQFKVEKLAGKSQIIEQVKDARIVTLSQFRSITGACREGVRHHLSQHGIDLDSINSMSLTEALNLMRGTSYGKEFAAHFEGASA